MNCTDAPGVYEGTKDARTECTAFVHEMFDGTKVECNSSGASADASGDVTPSVDAPTASSVSSHASHLSQEASSVFDKTLAISSDPHADPPMWGDDLEDFIEVAAMLGDMDDSSRGIQAFDQKDSFRSASSIKAVPIEEVSLGPSINDTAMPAHDYLETKRGCHESKGVDSNTAAAQGCEQDMNMDQRIFEDRVKTNSFDSVDHLRDSFDNRGALNDVVSNVLASKQEVPPTPPCTDTRVPAILTRNLPLQTELRTPATRPRQQQPTTLPIVTPVTFNGNPSYFTKSMQGKLNETLMTAFPSLTPVPKAAGASPEGTNNAMTGIELTRRSNASFIHGNRGAGAAKPRAKCERQDAQSALWQRRFLELENFQRSHGHCNVPQKYEKNSSLGSWVARQRLMMRQWEEQKISSKPSYDGSGSLSTSERIKRLRNLGLESSIGKGAFGKFCSRNANEWEKRYNELLMFREAHGHVNVPTKKSSLGRWVSRQRKSYHQYIADQQGKEDPEGQLGWSKELRSRFQRLSDIGFTFHIGKGGAQQKKSR